MAEETFETSPAPEGGKPMPKSMEHIERSDLYTSLPVRVQFLQSFLEFGPDDVQALITGQKYVKALIPAIVNIVYKKLLRYDITARVFTTRNSKDEGPVDHWVTEDSNQIQHRKMFLRWYLTKLNSDCTRMEYWEYLDKVGLMHVGKGRKNPLHVDYVFLGACLGFIQDAMFEAILSHPRLELFKKIAIVKALGKVIWIQNDLMERWHNADGQEFLDEEPLDETQEILEGYLNGKKVLGDDAASVGSSGTDTSRKSSESGKTILGRPIEQATHLMEGAGMNRCPFSGMAGPGHLDKQRVVMDKPPPNNPVNGSGNGNGLSEYHIPGTPRLKLVNGQTLLKGNLDPNPFSDAAEHKV
ncbi:hypothetical protein H072_8393 [Dactylellina haptotyla CBS 200.50]|uniref:Globin-sensor domain-containing protein n=1 Tax=Dactylellina haptotyla (strain CBS 200.50) TaxID=1284197 RepID=S8AA41_DACHA|nr:hypothetical protein H072_8393 [Dactylellina haptotyla CBS 200.50]